MKTHKEAFKNFKWKDRQPIYCEPNELTNNQQRLLIEDDVFCMLPWIHLHSYPDGRAYPCCDSNYDYPVGDLNKDSIESVWNNENMQSIRYNMLNGIKNKHCTRCYEAESHGFFSMRNSFNKHFGHHAPEVLPQTNYDGYLNIFKLRYHDIRFSNLCNMKCRTCGDTFSNTWAIENKKRHKWFTGPTLVFAGRSQDDMMYQLDQHIPHLEQVYFAGGEPLMMQEHYKLLSELVKREMFHVKLTYNTNLSRIEYNNQNILELWKLFDSVSVGASLDAEGKQAEYIRKGTKWDTILRNREQMLEVCPNVDFYLSPTVSIYNILTLPKFHKHWVELGYIEPKDFHCNILQGPENKRIDMLSPELKDFATNQINEHIEWLKQWDDATGRCAPDYKAIISLMDAADRTDLLTSFFNETDQIDAFRNESFNNIFPELKGLRNYVE